MIRDAAAGREASRTLFAMRYEPAVRAYLGRRWRGGQFAPLVDDAVQEMFVECFRGGGLLSNARPEKGEFRAFLYGALRNVALRFESRQARRAAEQNGLSELVEPADEATLSQVFDRAWALSMMRQARELQQNRAATRGDDAIRRVELLRLRFQENMPIRDIAQRWGEDAVLVHREYAKARREFQDALNDVLRFHSPGAGDIELECERLLALLA